VAILNPTPPERLVDVRGRPYFLWDIDLTLEDFRLRLEDPDAPVRGYFLGKLMRQAKPDDVLLLVTPQRLADDWDLARRHLGSAEPFWNWVLDWWRRNGIVR
jgi:hypothetical protein